MPRPFPFPATTGLEPTIAELLDDPVLSLLLARDGLNIADIGTVIQNWQGRRSRPWLKSDGA